MEDKLIIAGKSFNSRLFLGSGKFGDNSLIPRIIEKTGAEVITVALRRVEIGGEGRESILEYIPKSMQLMPNTSGARNAEEAVRIARLSRAAGCGDWVKIEVISDAKYLMPDNAETVEAAKKLVKEGFVVLPYISPDLMTAKRLEDAGVSAIMPLGAPIGSNRGLKTRELIEIIIDEVALPVIVDAGLGLPSHAAEAMEIGAAACLVNTGIASAADPCLMAEAFAAAVKAGRKAYIAGQGRVLQQASASSPLTGFLND